MKKIEKYVAENGCEFNTEAECIAYEKILIKLNDLFSKLPKHPDTCDFANGHGYIQHDRKTFNLVKKEFYKMACEYHKGLSKYKFENYGFWRKLSESGSPFYTNKYGIRPFYTNKYGIRLLNTDETTYREYGQMYFKTHSWEVTGGKINN